MGINRYTGRRDTHHGLVHRFEDDSFLEIHAVGERVRVKTSRKGEGPGTVVTLSPQQARDCAAALSAIADDLDAAKAGGQ
jgi:hypothetical protein